MSATVDRVEQKSDVLDTRGSPDLQSMTFVDSIRSEFRVDRRVELDRVSAQQTLRDGLEDSSRQPL